jgi:hypothetical protein
VNHIEELKHVIRESHRAEPLHVRSVPVKETCEDNTVREGIVEVFDLRGHPNANRVYAWIDEEDNSSKPGRPVTVLHIYPATSPEAAVRRAIVKERGKSPDTLVPYREGD